MQTQGQSRTRGRPEGLCQSASSDVLQVRVHMLVGLLYRLLHSYYIMHDQLLSFRLSRFEEGGKGALHL